MEQHCDNMNNGIMCYDIFGELIGA